MPLARVTACIFSQLNGRSFQCTEQNYIIIKKKMKTFYMLLYKGLGRNRLLVTAPRTSYKKGRKKMILIQTKRTHTLKLNDGQQDYVVN